MTSRSLDEITTDVANTASRLFLPFTDQWLPTQGTITRLAALVKERDLKLEEACYAERSI
jgi:hypothetical protein